MTGQGDLTRAEVNKLNKLHNDLTIEKELANERALEYSAKAGLGFVSSDLLQCKNNYITTCLVIVFACIKQVSYEMRSVQKLSDTARSQGRYIANRRIQFNTEAA